MIPKIVMFSKAYVVNTGNYENVRIEASLTCELEEGDVSENCFDYCKRVVRNELEEQLETIQPIRSVADKKKR